MNRVTLFVLRELSHALVGCYAISATSVMDFCSLAVCVICNTRFSVTREERSFRVIAELTS